MYSIHKIEYIHYTDFVNKLNVMYNKGLEVVQIIERSTGGRNQRFLKKSIILMRNTKEDED